MRPQSRAVSQGHRGLRESQGSEGQRQASRRGCQPAEPCLSPARPNETLAVGPGLGLLIALLGTLRSDKSACSMGTGKRLAA